MTAAGARRAAPFLVVLAAFVVRGLTVDLPVDRGPAAVATAGEDFAHERFGGYGETAAERGAILPVLVAIPASSGATPTSALRWVTLLLGSLVPLFLARVALAAGVAPGAAWLSAALCAAHPVLVAHAGGADASAATLVTGMVLFAARAFAGGGRVRTRAGSLVVALLPFADPLAVTFLPAFLWVALRREAAWGWRVASVVVGALAVLFGPSFSGGGGPVGFGSRAASLLVVWLPVVTLGVLLPSLFPGLRRLLGDGPARPALLAWAVGCALHLVASLAVPGDAGFRFGWAGLRAAVPVVPLLVLAGVVGLETRSARWRRLAPYAAFVVALPLALFLAWGPLQRFLLPGAVADAGRLSQLATAVRSAAAAAGPTGWVTYELGPGEANAEARLHDLLPGRRAGPLLRNPHGPEPLRLEDLPAGAVVGAVVAADLVAAGLTPGRRGIFVEEAVDRYGPWVVIRATRPR